MQRNLQFHSYFGGKQPTKKELKFLREHKSSIYAGISQCKSPEIEAWEPLDTIEELNFKVGDKLDYQSLIFYIPNKLLFLVIWQNADG